jgi:hypothetical protein
MMDSDDDDIYPEHDVSNDRAQSEIKMEDAEEGEEEGEEGEEVEEEDSDV